MTLESLFHQCLATLNDSALLERFVEKASVKDCQIDHVYGRERQQYWSGILRSQPVDVQDRNNAMLAYVAIYYRNQSSRVLPEWLEIWREEKFRAGELKTEVCALEALKMRKWEIRDVVLSSMLISSQNIPDYEFCEQDIPYWEKLRRKSQHFFVGMLCGDDMVGQFALTLITQDEYRAFIAAELNESALKGQALQGAGEYWGYISTVSIIPLFRSPRALRNLLGKVVDLLENAKQKQIRFAGLAANAYTREGEKLCKLFDMQYERPDKEHGKIYSVPGDKLYAAPIFKKRRKAKE